MKKYIELFLLWIASLVTLFGFILLITASVSLSPFWLFAGVGMFFLCFIAYKMSVKTERAKPSPRKHVFLLGVILGIVATLGFPALLLTARFDDFAFPAVFITPIFLSFYVLFKFGEIRRSVAILFGGLIGYIIFFIWFIWAISQSTFMF